MGDQSFGANLFRAIEDELIRREAEVCKKSLHAFTKRFFYLLGTGTEFIDNWHIHSICEHLEAVTKGQIKNLIINQPPGTMKSVLTSVMWPAWEWASNQQHRYFGASYSEALAIRDATLCRDIISSDDYRKMFPEVILKADSNQKTHYNLTGGGWRLATSVGGRGTGLHPSRKIIDDASTVMESESDVQRQSSLDWFDGTLATRGLALDAATIVVMQRLHAKDLAGHIMDGPSAKDWDCLIIPMEYEVNRRYPTTRLGYKDPRTKEGELLWPSLFDQKKVDRLKLTLGDYRAAGQLQQRPAPQAGGLLKPEKFRLWPSGSELPDIHYVVQSYDTAFTEQTQNDPTACTVWGIFHQGETKCVLLLDSWEERLEYPELKKRLFEDRNAKYGGGKTDQKMLHPPRKADIMLIENKGSGQSIIQDLRRANLPIQEFNPGKASKIQRANMAAPILDSGIVYVLESKREAGKPISWARPLIKQCESFPFAEHDDLCVARGSLITMSDGSQKAIEDVKVGEMVHTPNGPRRVTESRFTGHRPVMELVAGDYRLTATDNHPIGLSNGIYIRMDALTQKDILLCLPKTPFQSPMSRLWSLMGTGIAGIQNQLIALIGVTLVGLAHFFTVMFGLFIMAQYQTGLKSTTRTTTPQTTIFLIWRHYLQRCIGQCFTKISTITPTQTNNGRIWRRFGNSPKHGTDRKKEENGTARMPRNLISDYWLKVVAWVFTKESLLFAPVYGAASILSRLLSGLHFAAQPIKLKNQNTVGLDAVKPLKHTKDVFNLSVEGEHCYYANGILTHNCDTFTQSMIYLERSDFIALPFAPDDDKEDLPPVKRKANPYGM